MKRSTDWVMAGSRVGRYIRTRPLNGCPASSDTIKRIRRWLRKCEKDHSLCNRIRGVLASTRTPTRLVAVGDPNSSTVHLEETKETNRKPYVALSYCWGGPQEGVESTKSNVQDRLKGIQFQNLPNTIKDAVNVTRDLGYEYLWVDALCIVQDDQADKNREVQRMAQIYSGASLVISAARARSSNEGFLQPRDLTRAYGHVVKLQMEDEGGVAHPIFMHEYSVEDKAQPIDERGWTFQEHLMANRLLRFGSHQTKWECATEEEVDGGCDCHPTKIDPIAFTGKAGKRLLKLQDGILAESEWMFDNWMLVVEDYCARNLSIPSDKLLAFTALAERFALEMQGRSNIYCAGIWKEDMPMQLLWRTKTKTSAVTRKLTKSDTQEPNPSWSWASREAVEFLPRIPRPRARLTLAVIDCHIELQEQSLYYGEVQSGLLKVEGYMRKVEWDGYGFRSIHSFDTRIADPCSSIKPVFDSHAAELPGFLWCLEICTSIHLEQSYGILLAQQLDGSTFKRVGWFESRNNGNGQKKSWLHVDGVKTIFIA